MDDNALIKINSLSFSRGERKIFDGVDINIAKGKITAVMGPSGTGKTTLLRLIAAELQPSQGSVIVDGHNIHNLNRTVQDHKNMTFLKLALYDTKKDLCQNLLELHPMLQPSLFF